MHTLAAWLAHCERLHPKTIELGLDRVRAVAQRLQLAFTCPVITVAGTNGKGSTCAMLEAVALQAGWRTGVYTSPHLVHFEERCRIHGEIARAADLVPHFERVEAARQDAALTYFEFTTLAILSLMAAAPLDLAILEVGLGGRLDAVNIIEPDCAVITSVDLDHMDYLGPDREAIGAEKAGILRTGRPAIVSDPIPPQSVIDRANAIDADLWRLGHDFNFSGDQQQWAWAGRGRRYSGLAYPALRGANQLINASGALAALESLRSRIPVTAQAVRNGLAMVTGACLVIRFVRVAPPRFFPDLGYEDLSHHYGISVYGSDVTTGVSDQFAAMPSIHVAWAAVVSFGIVAASTSRWRWLFLLHVVLTTLVVAATANHWWMDGIVAVLLLWGGLALDTAVRSRWARRRGDLVPLEVVPAPAYAEER